MHELKLPDSSRRIFLNKTLQLLGAAAAMTAVPGYSAQTAAVATASQVKTPPLVFLKPEEIVGLDAIGDTMIPQGGAFELGARDVGLAKRIDAYLPKMDPGLATGFRGAVAFIEHQAPAMAGKAAPFSSLSEDERTAVLNAMVQAGGLPASIVVAMKFLCMSHFYTIDATWKYTGYDGPLKKENGQ